jgi:hypothetical protein
MALELRIDSDHRFALGLAIGGAECLRPLGRAGLQRAGAASCVVQTVDICHDSGPFEFSGLRIS